MNNLKNEDMNNCLYYLGDHKEDRNYTWRDISDILLKEYGVYLSPGAIQKRYAKFVKNRALRNLDDEDEQQIQMSEVEALLADMKMERTRISDERVAVNQMYRTLSREESLKEIAHDLASQMEVKLSFQAPKLKKVEKRQKYAILCISDVHYGLIVESSLNTYNIAICKYRLQKLVTKAIDIISKENITNLCVVNLGDLIAGRIHNIIRLNSRIDVISQIIEISELLAQILYTLSCYTTVSYVSTLDNHSRIEPIKQESLQAESLTRITDWFLRERCSEVVNFIDTEDDIASFNFGDKNIVAVHGHKDKPTNVIQNMRMLTGINYDICLMAHRHHFSADESHNTMMIANGSVCGTDQFAYDLRLHSNPSQNLIVLGNDSTTECLYKIDLN